MNKKEALIKECMELISKLDTEITKVLTTYSELRTQQLRAARILRTLKSK